MPVLSYLTAFSSEHLRTGMFIHDVSTTAAPKSYIYQEDYKRSTRPCSEVQNIPGKL